MPTPSHPSEPGYPGKSWERTASPGALGWSGEKLAAARAYAATISTDAVTIVVEGRVADESGEPAAWFNVHSIRKAFLSALIGIHVREARLRLCDTLADLEIDDNEPALTASEKGATVADLLKARSGVYHPALYETATNAAARPARAATVRAPSGTTTTGTSTPSERSWSARPGRASSRISRHASPTRSGWRTSAPSTGGTSAAPIRFTRPTHSARARHGPIRTAVPASGAMGERPGGPA